MEPIDFGGLCVRYALDVMRSALYMTGSRVEAEDITRVESIWFVVVVTRSADAAARAARPGIGR